MQSELHIIRNGAQTIRLYGIEIVRTIVVPYTAEIGSNFMLKDEYYKLHLAHFVDNFLVEKEIIRLQWPVCSQYMNSTELVWKILIK